MSFEDKLYLISDKYYWKIEVFDGKINVEEKDNECQGNLFISEFIVCDD